MRGKSSTICCLRRPTSQKRAYRVPKGAHRSAVLAFLGNRSLIRGSRTDRRFYQLHTLEFIVIARVESAVMFEHKAFKLPGSDRYWFAGFSFLEWVAFCHVTSFRLEVRPRAILCAVLFMCFKFLHCPVVMGGENAHEI